MVTLINVGAIVPWLMRLLARVIVLTLLVATLGIHAICRFCRVRRHKAANSNRALIKGTRLASPLEDPDELPYSSRVSSDPKYPKRHKTAMVLAAILLVTSGGGCFFYINRTPRFPDPGAIQLFAGIGGPPMKGTIEVEYHPSYGPANRVAVRGLVNGNGASWDYEPNRHGAITILPSFDLKAGQGRNWHIVLGGALTEASIVDLGIGYFQIPNGVPIQGLWGFQVTRDSDAVHIRGMVKRDARGYPGDRPTRFGSPVVLLLSKPLDRSSFSRRAVMLPEVLADDIDIQVVHRVGLDMSGRRVDSVFPSVAIATDTFEWRSKGAVSPSVVDTDLAREQLAQDINLMLGVMLGIAGSLLVAAWQDK